MKGTIAIFAFLIGAVTADFTRPSCMVLSYTPPVFKDYTQDEIDFMKRMRNETR